jgi:ABC-2 type transport system permease protein/oleandomycin transport system permease protein
MIGLSINHPSARPALATAARFAVRDATGAARRNLLRLVRTPLMVVLKAVEPAVFLVVFLYVFGGAIRVQGSNYVDYLTPAIFIWAVLFGGITTSINASQDLHGGIIDRQRSLPMARSAILAGRTLADLGGSVFTVAVMVGLGTLLGFRFHTGVPAIMTGMAMILVFAYASSWFFAAIGLATDDQPTAEAFALLPITILGFVSNSFVPVATMPGWLQPFARNQPVSVTVSCVRALFEGGPAAHWLWQALAWAAGIILLAFAITVRGRSKGAS